MYWGTATMDVFSAHKFKYPALSTAVDFCESMGFGYDIEYPNNRWFKKKNYIDNFKYKGNPEDIKE